jgi:hypothetical protein
MKLDVLGLMRAVAEVRGASKPPVRIAVNSITYAHWREYLNRFARLDHRAAIETREWVKTWTVAIAVQPVGLPRYYDLGIREEKAMRAGGRAR